MIKQFHYKDFLPLQKLITLKQESGTVVSLVIPAFNEEATVGDIISKTRKELVEEAPLLDEIILMDCDSNDGTIRSAQKSGAEVYCIDKVGDKNLPIGKGTALWKSLLITKGDIIICIDADIIDFNTRFVYGLIAPLLLDLNISFVKGYYKRPLIIDNIVLNNFGGRVTEILVRPALSTFYPDLARLFQPLAGEYSFRKDTVMKTPFFTGYGVEIGLILDIYKNFGASSFAQVDMDIRCHRNRNLTELGKMAFGILQVMLKKLKEDNKISFNESLNTTMISCNGEQFEESVINEKKLKPISTPEVFY